MSFKKEVESLREKIKHTLSAAFEEKSKALFDKYQTLKNFSWTQYTPYFADGDQCEFSVHYDVSINGVDENDDDSTIDPALKDAKDDAEKFLMEFEEEDLLILFGDHATITVTKTGIEITACEHE